MNAPLFSIIVPTFHSGAKIVATAASVLAQEEGLYELLVIDGGSSDDTLAHLRGHGSSLRWISEPDRGIYDAMNKGIRLSSGKFLLFLGAGDRLRAGVLRDLAATAVAGDSRGVDARPRLIYGDVWWESDARVYDGAFDAQRLCHSNICQQAIVYERSLFDRLGFFDLRYPLCADHAFNLRAFGDRGVHTQREERIIADYEGAGRSAVDVDRAFRRDWLRLAGRSFGWGFAFRHRFLPQLPGWVWARQKLGPRRAAPASPRRP